MRLSISRIGQQSARYYTGGATDGDPLVGGGTPGAWLGSACKELLAEGKVTELKLGNLLRGFFPDGMPLVRNAGRKERRAGWDLCFSVDKSLSLLWASSSIEARKKIEGVFEGVVVDIFELLEERYAVSRRGSGGANRARAKLVGARFTQFASRAGDPQLHIHLVIPNIGFLGDGGWGAIDSRLIYAARMALQALAGAELSRRLEVEASIPIRMRGGSYRVVEVPDALISAFSKRRAQIVDDLKRRGAVGGREAAKSALITRGVKPTIRMSEMERRWFSEVPELGGLARSVARAAARALRTVDPRKEAYFAKRSSSLGAQKLLRDTGAFSEAQLLRAAASLCQDGRSSLKALLSACKSTLNEPEFVKVRSKAGQQLYADRALIEVEKRALRRLERMQGENRQITPSDLLEDSMKRSDVLQLGGDQQAAYRWAVGNTGAVQCVTGLAGSGKTFMLRSALETWKQIGCKVLGCAVSGRAAQELESGSGIESMTVARLLGRLANARPIDYVRKHVLVVDEASMLGTRQFGSLLERADALGARLVLVGDEGQLQSIEAGGMFLATKERFGAASLVENWRQSEEWMVEASEQVRNGDVLGALSQYALAERIHVLPTEFDARENIVEAWAASDTASAKMLAGTNEEVDDINRRAQKKRFSTGDLGLHKGKIGKQTFYVGDEVIFTENDYQLNVWNGQFGKIVRLDVNPFGQAFRAVIEIGGESGRKVSVPLRNGPKFSLGYCITTYKAQGASLEEVFVLLNRHGTSRENLYVALTRSRAATRIFASAGDVDGGVEDLAMKSSWSSKKVALHDRLELEGRSME